MNSEYILALSTWLTLMGAASVTAKTSAFATRAAFVPVPSKIASPSSAKRSDWTHSSPAWHRRRRMASESWSRLHPNGRTVSTMSAVETEATSTDVPDCRVETRTWIWKGYDIRYKVAGEVRPTRRSCHEKNRSCDPLLSLLIAMHPMEKSDVSILLCGCFAIEKNHFYYYCTCSFCF